MSHVKVFATEDGWLNEQNYTIVYIHLYDTHMDKKKKSTATSGFKIWIALTSDQMPCWSVEK